MNRLKQGLNASIVKFSRMASSRRHAGESIMRNQALNANGKKLLDAVRLLAKARIFTSTSVERFGLTGDGGLFL
jgi:hypothetical protein